VVSRSPLVSPLHFAARQVRLETCLVAAIEDVRQNLEDRSQPQRD
jgi:hypothetical protein